MRGPNADQSEDLAFGEPTPTRKAARARLIGWRSVLAMSQGRQRVHAACSSGATHFPRCTLVGPRLLIRQAGACLYRS